MILYIFIGCITAIVSLYFFLKYAEDFDENKKEDLTIITVYFILVIFFWPIVLIVGLFLLIVKLMSFLIKVMNKRIRKK